MTPKSNMLRRESASEVWHQKATQIAHIQIAKYTPQSLIFSRELACVDVLMCLENRHRIDAKIELEIEHS